MTRMYAPVALVIDDDPFAAGRVHREFLTKTSLGVLEARDLETAYRFIRDPNLKIDVVVTDVGFTPETRYEDDHLELHDGLDFIAQVERLRPDLESYILSVLVKAKAYHDRATKEGLRIAAWVDKLDSADVYRDVERACMVKALKRDSEFRDSARAAGVDVRDFASDEAIADRIRNTLVLPRLTYLRRLPTPFEISQPIEVLCVKETDDECYRASAPHIGLITDATGDTVQDALDKLGDLIVAEFEFFEQATHAVVGYAAHVRDMLGMFVRRVPEEEEQGISHGERV